MKTDVLHAVRLARTDLKLLGRNFTALFNAVILPLLFGAMFSLTAPDATFVLTGLPGVMLAFAVFLNLVNTFTARREELVLKRLRGGQGSALAIFGGAGLAAFAVFAFQVVLLAIWIDRTGGGLPANIPVMLGGAVLGVAVFSLLAAAFSGITPTAESVQVAVLPPLMVMIFASPLVVPLSAMPDALAVFARMVPATPVIEIMRAGYTGELTSGLWLYVGILGVWLIIGAALAKWLFRWDPRHS
ncbi:ABC transporter permease [Nonomuraea sp. NPDC050310]|uniref:ABC transporter permease n=1 Tax=unclassified Nonomuraea TaxID=2593643 RepID=UPI0033FE4FB0